MKHFLIEFCIVACITATIALAWTFNPWKKEQPKKEAFYVHGECVNSTCGDFIWNLPVRWDDGKVARTCRVTKWEPKTGMYEALCGEPGPSLFGESK